MFIVRSCPLCDNNNTQFQPIHFSKGDFPVKKCPCGFVFIEKVPTYTTLESEYSWDRTFAEKKRIRKLNCSPMEKFCLFFINGIRSTINTFLKRDKFKSLVHKYFRDGYIIDLGCDIGYNCHVLPPACKPIGIEISAELVRIATPIFEASGGKVIHDNVLSALKTLPDESYSGAIAKSYLEHEIYVAEVLEELNRVMMTNAPVIIKVPNYRCWNRYVRGKKWCGFRLPDHVNYFTPYSLRRMLTSYGFEICHFSIFDKLPTSDNMWCIARKK